MQLKFFARGDLLVTVPGFSPVVGQAPAYVGREFKRIDGVAVHPATRDPFTVDSDTPEGRRLVKLAKRDASLWPADKATAEHCGLPFVALAFDDGEWIPEPLNKARSNA